MGGKMTFALSAINIYDLCKGDDIVVFLIFVGVDLEVIVADLLKGLISVKSR